MNKKMNAQITVNRAHIDDEKRFKILDLIRFVV